MARLVLLEPDRVLAEQYRRVLELDGHQVVPCASAQAAIMAADQALPALIIVELQLIEHSGIEFLYELRSYADWQTIPVIIHSGVPTAEFAGQWQVLKGQLRIDHYLYKPTTSLADLRRAVHEQLAIAV